MAKSRKHQGNEVLGAGYAKPRDPTILKQVYVYEHGGHGKIEVFASLISAQKQGSGGSWENSSEKTWSRGEYERIYMRDVHA